MKTKKIEVEVGDNNSNFTIRGTAELKNKAKFYNNIYISENGTMGNSFLVSFHNLDLLIEMITRFKVEAYEAIEELEGKDA